MAIICLILLLLFPLGAMSQGRHHMLFGHNDAMLYGRNWSNGARDETRKNHRGTMPDVYQVCGAYPALFSTDLDGIEQQGRTIYWGDVSYDRMREAILRQHRGGGMVTISWHMRNPEHGQTYMYKEEYHGTVERILQRKGKTYEQFLAFLGRGADFLLSLRDDDGKLIPVIFRPWHECNGSWAWWGTSDCTPEQYVELWRMTRKYMEGRGLVNLRYAFSPGAWFGDKAEYMQRFPGREYVDIIGTECYCQTGKNLEESRRAFRIHLQKNLQIAKAVADSLGLPYAITETGMPPDSDPRWWTLCLTPAMEGYSPMFVNFWSNQCLDIYPEGTTWCTYPGEASARDFRKFYKRNKASFIKKL